MTEDNSYNEKLKNGKYQEIKQLDENSEYSASTFGRRHQQCLILFFALIVAYTIRSCMGVCLVAMTDLSFNEEENLTNSNTSSNAGGILDALMLLPPYPTFTWNKKVQDTILSSFFWGYMLLQVPAGHLAHKFGAKYLLVGSLSINAAVSLVTPWAAYYGGWICITICRIILGLSQACILPGTYTLFGKWVPLEERGRLSAITVGSSSLGPVIGFTVTGFIASSTFGWPGVFRFYGILALLASALLWWKVADSPALHPDITPSERNYIEKALGQTGTNKKPRTVPWKKIMTSRGVYAMIIAHVGQSWGALTLYAEVPAFMDKVLGVNIKANGLLSSLPFFLMWIVSFFYSWLTDMLIVKKILTVTWTRKLAQTIGTILPGLGLIALAFVPKNIYTVEVLLILICIFKVATNAGLHVNHVDISPNFAGTLFSVTNFISNLCGSLAPIFAGYVLTDVTDEYLWRQVFFMSAGLYIVSGLVYLVIGTAQKAEWNESSDDDDDDLQVETVPMVDKNSKKLDQ